MAQGVGLSLWVGIKKCKQLKVCMLFSSFEFIFLFLPIVLFLYYWIKHKKLQLWFLLLSSLFFYCYWSTVYVFLLLFTVVFDFYIARWLYIMQDTGKRKILVTLSIITNLSILGFFKYYNFFVDTANGLIGRGSDVLPVLDLVLPIGISFYTFQSMSYVIDVYRRKCDAHGGLLAFAGYVSLFPHQISGPLVRHNTIVPQLEDPQTYVFNSDNFWRGICFFVLGLSKKLLIADRIAAAVDPWVLNLAGISNAEAWLAMLGYSFQLYFDFSGYSDMAVGLGLMMNIRFPQNFNSPYKALSISDFWRRWHMTLSAWLRDYLYISLGGNRVASWKIMRNLFITMALGGLWHGANWTFLIWGAIHGCLMCIERLFENRGWVVTRNRFIKTVYTYLAVCLAWVFFRSESMNTAVLWIKKIFFLNENVSWNLHYLATANADRFWIALSVAVGIVFFSKNTFEMKFKANALKIAAMVLLFILSLMFITKDSPFLYFQF